MKLSKKERLLYTPLTFILPISYLPISQFGPRGKIITHPPTADQVAAADPTLFDTDPLQPEEIHLHSWMLYTSQVPILDLTGEHIKTKENIETTFHALHLCPEEEEEQKSDGRQGKRTTKSK